MTDMMEMAFNIGELFDVGGQGSEWKKWMDSLENVTALVFLISVSEYNQMLYEDENAVCDH